MSSLDKQLKKQLCDKTIPKYKSWIGHRVQVCDEDGEEWVGNLTYVGACIRKGVIQATIGSTPIFPIKLETLKLI